MIDNKKVSSYLLYAVGEVFLVVLGILIAVQINDWNDQKKLDKQAENLLLQIQDEIVVTIEDMDEAMAYYYIKDSLFQIYKTDTLSDQEYANIENKDLWLFTYQWHPFEITNDGYHSFVQQVDQFAPKYKKLTTELQNVYTNTEIFLTFSSNSMDKIVKEQYEFAKTQPYYNDDFDIENFFGVADSLSPSLFNYLRKDFRYKNAAVSYHNASLGLAGRLRQSKSGLIDLYISINTTLNKPRELPKIIRNYYMELPLKEMEQFVGTYVNHKNDTTKITLENNQLNHIIENDTFPIKVIQNKYLMLNGRRYSYDLSQGKICYKILYKDIRCSYKQ